MVETVARVNQPLISQSARELRVKEKLLGYRKSLRGKLLLDKFTIDLAIVREFVFFIQKRSMVPLYRM